MSELVIRYHDFENAKGELKKFSEQTTTDLDLKMVDDSKGVGEFFGDLFLGRGIGLDHKVTGEELNELTSQVQAHLHSINNTQIKLIKEFGQVYSALEALDKDYIQAILISIKATEETSQSIQETQSQIKKIVENQRRTLEELKKFKQKLDGYSHLSDIDKIWSYCLKWTKEINDLSETIDEASERSKESEEKVDEVKAALTMAEKKIEDLSNQSSGLIEKLGTIIAFTSSMEKVTHLKDVDEMWESLSSAHDSIRSISGKFDSIQRMVTQNQADINKLLSFMEHISAQNHLTEVDVIWEQMEEHQLRMKGLEQADKIYTDKLDALAQTDDNLLEHVDSYAHDIECLKEYKENLAGISHLEDVDNIWENVDRHASLIAECKQRDEEFAVAVQNNKEEAEKMIAGAVKTTSFAVESLKNQIRYAYLIAGTSAGLAIIELIILLMKVI